MKGITLHPGVLEVWVMFISHRLQDVCALYQVRHPCFAINIHVWGSLHKVCLYLCVHFWGCNVYHFFNVVCLVYVAMISDFSPSLSLICFFCTHLLILQAPLLPCPFWRPKMVFKFGRLGVNLLLVLSFCLENMKQYDTHAARGHSS